MSDDTSKVVEFFALLNDMNRISHALVQRAYDFNNIDITTEQWQTLGIIYDNAPISPIDISRKTLKNKGAVTRVIAGLQKRGLVIKEYGDKKNTFDLILSKAGFEALDAAYTIGDQTLSKLTDGGKADDLQSAIDLLKHAFKIAKE